MRKIKIIICPLCKARELENEMIDHFIVKHRILDYQLLRNNLILANPQISSALIDDELKPYMSMLTSVYQANDIDILMKEEINKFELDLELNNKTNDLKSNDLKSNDLKSNDLKSNDLKIDDFQSNDLKIDDFQSNDLKDDDLKNDDFNYVTSDDLKNNDLKDNDLKNDDLKNNDFNYVTSDDLKDNDLKNDDLKSNDFKDNDLKDSNSYNSLESFKVGDCFSSYDQLKENFVSCCTKEYCKTLNKNRNHLKKDNIDLINFPFYEVQLNCVHYGKPENKPTKKIRTKTSTKKLECPFSLRALYQKKTKNYKITKFVNIHKNHPLTKEYYKSLPSERKFDEEQKKKYFDDIYLRLDPKPAAFKRIVREDLDINLKTQDLINMKLKHCPQEKNDAKSLVQFLDEYSEKNPGTTVQYGTFKEKDSKLLKFVYLQTPMMKNAFKSFGDVLLVDGTYNLTNEGYTLYPFVCIDNHGVSVTVAMILVADETKFTLENAFKLFAENNNVGKVQFVMTDKCHREINSLQKHIPNAQFLICQYHCMETITKNIKEIHLASKDQFYKDLLT